MEVCSPLSMSSVVQLSSAPHLRTTLPVRITFNKCWRRGLTLTEVSSESGLRMMWMTTVAR